MKKLRKSIRRVSLTVFLIAMLACAGLVLAGFWADAVGEVVFDQFMIVPTLFVIGLASFLIWFVIIVQEIYEKYTRERG